MKLYELTEEIRVLEAMLDAEEVDPDSFQAALRGMSEERDIKIANIGLLIKEKRAANAARREAKARLDAGIRADTNTIARLTDYIYEHIDGPVKTPLVNIYKIKGKQSVSVNDDAQLPDRFYRKELDKTELKKALQDGEQYHGVQMITGDDSVGIR